MLFVPLMLGQHDLAMVARLIAGFCARSGRPATVCSTTRTI
jgi:hypothetical protein